MAATNVVSDPNLATAIQISGDARGQALGLVDFVLSTDDADLRSSDILSQTAQRTKILNTNLSQLRGLHRAAHIGTRNTKARTAEARQEVDKLHLQLQNLYYEQRYLQGEISACESYEYVRPGQWRLNVVLIDPSCGAGTRTRSFRLSPWRNSLHLSRIMLKMMKTP